MRLTPTSYIVLGLLDSLGEATPYELKAAVAGGVGNLWTLQHAQLYTEPERLSGAGLVSERREQTGRRRRHYRLTDGGRGALRAWLEEPAEGLYELRDPGLLKLYFGADPAALAQAQMDAHERRLAEYRRLRGELADDGGPAHTLDAGIGHEREFLRFWRSLLRR